MINSCCRNSTINGYLKIMQAELVSTVYTHRMMWYIIFLKIYPSLFDIPRFMDQLLFK